jgi:hypothetical protein
MEPVRKIDSTAATVPELPAVREPLRKVSPTAETIPELPAVGEEVPERSVTRRIPQANDNAHHSPCPPKKAVITKRGRLAYAGR